MAFEFTSNIYTGEKQKVLVDINELILGISVSLEMGYTLVYAGDVDEDDDVAMFALDTDYINQLRRSPEYHDAVSAFIRKQPAFAHYNSMMRSANYEVWVKLMYEYGVIGTVSLYPIRLYQHEAIRPDGRI